VLEAPQIQDDFYLNLIDWGSQNVLAVGLGAAVYLWNAQTAQVSRLTEVTDDTIASLSWTERGPLLAVGTNGGSMAVWDAQTCQAVRTFKSHKSRVGTLCWNGSILTSGSRDRHIYHHDMRSPKQYVAKLVGHKQEVCGLRWSPDGQYLASGGNDNRLLVWTPHASVPVQTYADHSAAVKAIAWSPHQRGLLASGGGTADRTIRFRNVLTGSNLHSVDTGSQVCNLAWSKNVNEIVSTHGYSQNQIVVWSYPTMTPLARLTGHLMRVLYLAVAPDGQTIVTGAGDETLRFWLAFPPSGSKVRGRRC
jgi:cell division cycle 20-like protein 1 (cofactor of APC complex)